MNVVHQGRGGYIEIDGCQYPIELLQGGHFCILFPNKQRHRNSQQHLDALAAFARAQQPAWSVENRSKLVETPPK